MTSAHVPSVSGRERRPEVPTVRRDALRPRRRVVSRVRVVEAIRGGCDLRVRVRCGEQQRGGRRQYRYGPRILQEFPAGRLAADRGVTSRACWLVAHPIPLFVA